VADLSRVRKQFTVLAGVLAGIAVLALVYLVLPLGRTNAELYRDLDETRTEFKLKEAQVKPLRGLPTKLVSTHGDIAKFYRERLPSRQSEVSEEIGRIASKNGVTLSDVRYESLETELPDIRAIDVEANLSGPYANVVRFINSVERNKRFFLINGLSLDDQKAGAVKLQLKLETFLRPGNIEESPEKPAGKGGAGSTKAGD
jgi:type IV pilus assembly protein PilO